MNCRFCNNTLTNVFVDLNSSPPSNAFLIRENLHESEIYYPLILHVCDKCFLVQIDEYKRADEIFNPEYVYFSSYSSSWLKHCENYSDKIAERLGLNGNSLVVEIASNDGYLLQYFKKKGIPVLGVEPTQGTADIALSKGIDTMVEFFTKAFAEKMSSMNRQADLLIGNNVVAHVPNINDFIAGQKIILKKNGTITLEFPHLMRLVESCQFDTIYHEHFSYLSFTTIEKIFAAHGLTIYDVDELTTHGGSLRIYGQHAEYTAMRPVEKNVKELRDLERSLRMDQLDYYMEFQQRVNGVKYKLLEFLVGQKLKNRRIAAYGAAAKGNTLLNYCGVKGDMIDYVVDISPYKQGKYLPGSHIPVVDESEIKKQKPENILILPWNIQDEILEQLSYVKDWDANFIIPIPELKIIPSSSL